MTPESAGRAVLADAYTLNRLQDSSPAWALLRAQNAPAVLSVLGAVFSGDVRQIEGSEFVLAIEPMLVDIREQTDLEMKGTATSYLTEWVKAGWLIRRSPQGTREEIYEPSTDALAALEYVRQLASPQRSVTRSRLSTLMASLQSLATETDPDEATAIAQLERQKREIEARIQRIRERGVEAIGDEEAVEKAREALSLVRDLPTDFARVRTDVEDIDRGLREAIVEEEVDAADVLDNVFRGVDLISDSEAGRAFTGFHELLFDREQAARLDAMLEAILSRDFMAELSPDERVQLRRLVPSLESSSTDVHDAMTGLSRSLRRFVQSREAESQQALASTITRAQGLALQVGRQLSDVRTSTGLDLELTTSQPRSLSTWVLHDPEDYRIQVDMQVNEPGEIDLERMRERIRESEIDWAELHAAVNETVGAEGVASISAVLARHPASQGLASVIGLIRLAQRYGTRDDGTEWLQWTTSSGRRLRGRYTTWLFDEPVADLPRLGVTNE